MLTRPGRAFGTELVAVGSHSLCRLDILAASEILLFVLFAIGFIRVNVDSANTKTGRKRVLQKLTGAGRLFPSLINYYRQ
jgi:hypothetical protein